LNVWESFELGDRQIGLYGSVVAPGTQHEAVLKETFLGHLVEPSTTDAVRYKEQVDLVTADLLLEGVAQQAGQLRLAQHDQLPTPYPEPHCGHPAAEISSMNGTNPAEIRRAALPRCWLWNGRAPGHGQHHQPDCGAASVREGALGQPRGRSTRPRFPARGSLSPMRSLWWLFSWPVTLRR
jgi:hypothetical protein